MSLMDGNERKGQVLECLWEALYALARAEAMLDGAGGYEARMLKLAGTIKHVESSGPDTMAKLQAVEDFVRHCMATLSEAKLDVMREAVSTYMDALRASASRS